MDQGTNRPRYERLWCTALNCRQIERKRTIQTEWEVEQKWWPLFSLIVVRFINPYTATHACVCCLSSRGQFCWPGVHLDASECPSNDQGQAYKWPTHIGLVSPWHVSFILMIEMITSSFDHPDQKDRVPVSQLNIIQFPIVPHATHECKHQPVSHPSRFLSTSQK